MSEKIVHALKFRFLNRIYDYVVALTCRDNNIKNAIINTNKIQNADKVLDIGCGTGTLLLKIKRRYKHCDITGVDADDKILEIAKNKAYKENTSILLFKAYAQELLFNEGTFNVVVSSLMFHHLDNNNKQKAFREIYRILKPEGKLILADWDSPQNILSRLGFFMLRILDGFHNTELHLEGKIPEMIKQVGFSSVKVNKNINTIFGTVTIWIAEK